MKYSVGSIIQCNQRGSSRYGAIGVVFFADERGERRSGVVRYRVNWFIAPSGYIREDEDIGEYKSDWLENNSEIWKGSLKPKHPDDIQRERFICIVKDSDKPPVVVHESEEVARRECERLSERHDREVRLAKIVGHVKPRKVVRTELDWDNE